jgi:hypothetical protein
MKVTSLGNIRDENPTTWQYYLMYPLDSTDMICNGIGTKGLKPKQVRATGDHELLSRWNEATVYRHSHWPWRWTGRAGLDRTCGPGVNRDRPVWETISQDVLKANFQIAPNLYEHEWCFLRAFQVSLLTSIRIESVTHLNVTFMHLFIRSFIHQFIN